MKKKVLICAVTFLLGFGICFAINYLSRPRGTNPRLVVMKMPEFDKDSSPSLSGLEGEKFEIGEDGVLESTPADFEVFAVVERTDDKILIQYRLPGDGTFLSTIPASEPEKIDYIVLKSALEDCPSYQVAYFVD